MAFSVSQDLITEFDVIADPERVSRSARDAFV